MPEHAAHIVTVNVGSSRTSFGLFSGRELVQSRTMPNSSASVVADEIESVSRELDTFEHGAVIVASVNAPFSDAVVESLAPRLSCRIFRMGVDLPIPIDTRLGPHAAPGQDRLLAALAAYRTTNQACVVIDAGTAVTIDFVDGAGVFHGGAIAPGARMMLKSMHDTVAHLPDLDIRRPEEDAPFGKDTEQAMLNGVYYGIRGMVRMLLERYAEHYQAYPQVIATGGDARLLFADDELVEHIADELVLQGIMFACESALTTASENGADSA